MTAALAISTAPETVHSEVPRERVHVLESRPGVREVLLVTTARARSANDQHAVILLSGGGGGFAVTCLNGVPCVQGGLPLSQRQRLANAIGLLWLLPGLVCAAMYLAMSLPLSRLARRLEQRWGAGIHA